MVFHILGFFDGLACYDGEKTVHEVASAIDAAKLALAE